MNLYEKYRPASWTEIVGQEKAIGQILGLKQRGGLSCGNQKSDCKKCRSNYHKKLCPAAIITNLDRI